MALSFACVVETDDATVFLEPPNIARRISDAEGTDTDGAYVPYDRFALVVAGFIPPARSRASIAAASAAATRRQSSSRSIASASAPSDASRSVEAVPVRESGGIDAETSARSAGTSASRRVPALFAFFGTSDAVAFLASSSSASSIPRAAPKHRDAKRRRVATSFVFAKTSIDDSSSPNAATVTAATRDATPSQKASRFDRETPEEKEKGLSPPYEKDPSLLSRRRDAAASRTAEQKAAATKTFRRFNASSSKRRASFATSSFVALGSDSLPLSSKAPSSACASPTRTSAAAARAATDSGPAASRLSAGSTRAAADGGPAAAAEPRSVVASSASGGGSRSRSPSPSAPSSRAVSPATASSTRVMAFRMTAPSSGTTSAGGSSEDRGVRSSAELASACVSESKIGSSSEHSATARRTATSAETSSPEYVKDAAIPSLSSLPLLAFASRRFRLLLIRFASRSTYSRTNVSKTPGPQSGSAAASATGVANKGSAVALVNAGTISVRAMCSPAATQSAFVARAASRRRVASSPSSFGTESTSV
mmetsp:Transcript_10702/g.45591  ORF Transcript_10702/g.45591 Transcript_10702/m.45591 type:complete len:539 (+) Transcript_10702:1041-2657(+)